MFRLPSGLTAKVFRTYNASSTLQNQLDELTEEDTTIPEKMLAYNRANRAVAILCNHQRAVPKTHGKSMENIREKIRLKREQIDDCQRDLKVSRLRWWQMSFANVKLLSGHQTRIRKRRHWQGEEKEATGAFAWAAEQVGNPGDGQGRKQNNFTRNIEA